MEHAIIALIGAVMRRVWGGYLSPNSLVKRVLTCLLAIGCAFYQYGEVVPSLIMGGIILFAFLMPYHGFGIAMGRNPTTRPAWLCLLVMALQYGGISLVGTLAMGYFGHIYLPLGFLVPVAYWVAVEVFERKAYVYGSFLDSKTAYAELAFGVCFGALYGYELAKTDNHEQWRGSA